MVEVVEVVEVEEGVWLCKILFAYHRCVYSLSINLFKLLEVVEEEFLDVGEDVEVSEGVVDGVVASDEAVEEGGEEDAFEFMLLL